MGVKLFKINPEIFAGWKTGLKIKIKDGFPDDAKVMDAKIQGNEIVMEIWSKYFNISQSESEIYFVPVIERIDDAKEKTNA